MHLGPAVGVERLRECAPGDLVCERERRQADRTEDVRVHRSGDDLPGRRLAGPGRRRQRRDVERGDEHGRVGEEPFVDRAECVRAVPDEVEDARGQMIERRARRLAGIEHLAEEEGLPTGERVHRGRPAVDVRDAALRQQAGDRDEVEAAENHPLHEVVLLEGGREVREAGGTVGCRGAGRRQHRDPGLGVGLHQVAEEHQEVGAGAVQIVEHQQDRRPAGERGDARHQRPPELLRAEERVTLDRRTEVGQPVSQAGDDRGELGRPPAEAQAQLGIVELEQDVDEPLGNCLDRRQAYVVAGRGQHHRVVLDPPGDLEREARLADPRLTLDEDQPPASGRDRTNAPEDAFLLRARPMNGSRSDVHGGSTDTRPVSSGTREGS